MTNPSNTSSGESDERETEFCPQCGGTGDTVVMSDGGPDAYEVTVNCPHCHGKQTLYAAYQGVVDLLDRAEIKLREASAVIWRAGTGLGGGGDAVSQINNIADYLANGSGNNAWCVARLRGLAALAPQPAAPAEVVAPDHRELLKEVAQALDESCDMNLGEISDKVNAALASPAQAPAALTLEQQRELRDIYLTPPPTREEIEAEVVTDEEMAPLVTSLHARMDALRSTMQAPAAPARQYETPGYALAMRVMQSPLYNMLDDRERAECDELIRIGQAPAAPSVGEPAALPDFRDRKALLTYIKPGPFFMGLKAMFREYGNAERDEPQEDIARDFHKSCDDMCATWEEARSLLAATPPAANTVTERPTALGCTVSVDVSTGDADAGHRIFAKVSAMQQEPDGEWTLLAEETSRNFSNPPAAPAATEAPSDAEWRKCADAAMKLAGEATAKLDALKPMLVGAHARLQLASVYTDIQSMYLLRAYVERCVPASVQPVPASLSDDLWYLQDTRSFIGNDVTWWALGGNGYTTDLRRAQTYSREDAFRQAASRGCDRAWPKAYIDSKSRPAVDFQHIDHHDALATTSSAASEVKP